MLNSTAESTSLRIKAEGHSLSRWAFSALIIGALFIAFSPTLVRLSELPPTATAFRRVFLALPFFLAWNAMGAHLSLIHISEPTRLRRSSYAVFCLKKKNHRISTIKATIQRINIIDSRQDSRNQR